VLQLYSLFDLDAKLGRVVNATHRPLWRRGRDPVPILRQTRWAPQPVWTGAENLDPTGNRSPDSPDRKESI